MTAKHGGYAKIVPQKARTFASQWCNTWSLMTHDWQIVIGFGHKDGTTIFHRCKHCRKEQEVTLDVDLSGIVIGAE